MDYSYHYRKWHADTPEQTDAKCRYYARILSRHLPADKRARILDVGCGMGFALQALRKMGYTQCSGVDVDAGQVASCQAKGLAVSLSTNTAAFLREQAGALDLILALDLLEHIPLGEQVGFVQALATALRPGGLFLCTVPNANSALGARWRYIDWTHHASFTEHSLDFLLHTGGLTDIRVEPVEFFEAPRAPWLLVGPRKHWLAFRFFRWWRRLEMMAELGPAQGRQVPLSLNILAVASKPSQP